MNKSESYKDPLVAELTRVSNRRFDMLDERRGSYKPLAGIDELTALAYEFTADDTGLKRWQRIERLIRAATQIVEDGDHKKRVEILFGLSAKLALYTARALHKNIKDSYYKPHTDPKKIYADNQESLAHLATAIRLLMLRHRHSLVGRYIRREAYHQRINEALDAGHGVIELVGLPGMGKTRLAEALVRERQGTKPVLKIRFNNDVMRIEDLYSALDKWEVPAPVEAVAAHPTAFLANLLCGEHAPHFVILDNLDDASAAWKVLPDEHKTTVIITARAESRPVTRNHSVIGIMQMQEPEAIALARCYLPELADGDLRLFARNFHGYPLLIVHAATLLAYQCRSVTQFCDDIRARARLLSDDAHTDDGKTLTAVLAAILEIVTSQSPIAMEIISVISYLDGRLIFPQFIFLYLRAGRMLAVSQVEVDIAMMQLARFRLIESVYSTRHPDRVKFVHIHPFVCEIIQTMSDISLDTTRAAFLNTRLRLGQHAYWCEQTGKNIRPSLTILYLFVSIVPLARNAGGFLTVDSCELVMRDAHALHADHLPSLFLETAARKLSEIVGANLSLNSIASSPPMG